jgi:hypothetical protein
MQSHSGSRAGRNAITIVIGGACAPSIAWAYLVARQLLHRPRPSHKLALSAARAYDCALSILGAYKLTGNFHTNLELVLRDIGAFDKVTFEVKTGDRLLYLTDCRRVLFRPRENVHIGQFRDIICSIKNRLEFRGIRGRWIRVLHRPRRSRVCRALPVAAASIFMPRL